MYFVKIHMNIRRGTRGNDPEKRKDIKNVYG